MGSHGIRNRSPHAIRVVHPIERKSTDKPGEPSGWALVHAGIGFVLIVALWAVVVTLILAS